MITFIKIDLGRTMAERQVYYKRLDDSIDSQLTLEKSKSTGKLRIRNLKYIFDRADVFLSGHRRWNSEKRRDIIESTKETKD